MNLPSHLDCTIAICDGFNLLLPQNLIADLVSRKGMRPADAAQSSPWILGDLTWRGLTMPVISIEQLVLRRLARLRGSHVAIFRGTTDPERLPFYAVPLQAVPHTYSVRLDREIAEREDAQSPDFTALKVTVRGVSAIIPDFNALETRILGD